MSAHAMLRMLVAAAALSVGSLLPLQAQQAPTAGAIAAAREIIEIKGGLNMFDPVIVGVVEHHKNLIEQANPTASKDLEAVAAQLRNDLQSRLPQVHAEIARGYAEQFTEQELKDLVVFYKTPLGKKVIDGEPKGLDAASKRVEAWAERLAVEVTSRLRGEMKKRGHNLL